MRQVFHAFKDISQMPYGVLKPSCDLDSLSQIFIITAFNVVE